MHTLRIKLLLSALAGITVTFPSANAYGAHASFLHDFAAQGAPDIAGGYTVITTLQDSSFPAAVGTFSNAASLFINTNNGGFVQVGVVDIQEWWGDQGGLINAHKRVAFAKHRDPNTGSVVYSAMDWANKNDGVKFAFRVDLTGDSWPNANWYVQVFDPDHTWAWDWKATKTITTPGNRATSLDVGVWNYNEDHGAYTNTAGNGLSFTNFYYRNTLNEWYYIWNSHFVNSANGPWYGAYSNNVNNDAIGKLWIQR